ncbi:hypothetical protein Acr_20g0003330 [Actinidia rufa]|uniref:Uncharacterized protein n=1 Tax=Actinidia rufa TaxID=165716 RepID=A0A7J0GCI9_9ERIC|nr:hypothetical protein Acr_20g0003330 [Actinidia rufa]
MESYVRRSWSNHWAAKYGNRVRGSRSKKKKLPYRECTPNVREVTEMEPQGHLVLRMVRVLYVMALIEKSSSTISMLELLVKDNKGLKTPHYVAVWNNPYNRKEHNVPPGKESGLARARAPAMLLLWCKLGGPSAPEVGAELPNIGTIRVKTIVTTGLSLLGKPEMYNYAKSSSERQRPTVIPKDVRGQKRHGWVSHLPTDMTVGALRNAPSSGDRFHCLAVLQLGRRHATSLVPTLFATSEPLLSVGVYLQFSFHHSSNPPPHISLLGSKEFDAILERSSMNLVYFEEIEAIWSKFWER